MKKTPIVEVEETSEYDNFMDRLGSTTVVSITEFMGEDVSLQDKWLLQSATPPVPKKDDGCYITIYVHFRNRSDLQNFANLIDQDITTTKINYPYKDTSLEAIFGKEEKSISDRMIPHVTKKKKSKSHSNELDGFGEIPSNSWKKHWVAMPEFVQEDNPPFFTVTISFQTKDDYEKFASVIDQNLSEKTKSIWFPKLERQDIASMKWMEK